MATPLQELLSQLWVVQSLDSALQHRRRLLAGLETGAAARAALESARKAWEEKQRLATALNGSLKDSELKLSTLETKQKAFVQKLYQGTVTNPKELSNLEKEIAALGRQRGDLDEQILGLMESVEAAQAASQRADAERQAADSALQSVLAAADAKRAHWEQEIAGLTAQRAAAVGQVTDAALLKRYETLRAKHGGIGLAKAEDGQCGACHMTLPTTLTRALRAGEELQTCDNCGRLLTIG